MRMMVDVLKLLVVALVGGCSIYGGEPEAVDAGVPVDVAEVDCGPAPIGPEWASWEATFAPGQVTLTTVEYDKVSRFRDKAIAWMTCAQSSIPSQ